MRTWRFLSFLLLLTLHCGACSIISKKTRDNAEPPVAFDTLLEQVDAYVGKTVILGGYILEVKNRTGKTLIAVLQAPLTFQDYPTSRARSQGRFLVSHNEFLDPDVYKPDSKITLAGKVIGLSDEAVEMCPSPCLYLESQEIYIKKEIDYDYNDTTDAYDFDDWTSSWERPYR